MRSRAEGGELGDPAWYVKRATWQESLLASRQAAAERGADLPFKSEVVRVRTTARNTFDSMCRDFANWSCAAR